MNLSSSHSIFIAVALLAPRVAAAQTRTPTADGGAASKAEPIAAAGQVDAGPSTVTPSANAPSASDAGTSPSARSAPDVDTLKKEVEDLKVRLEQVQAGTASQNDVAGVQQDLENFKYQYQRDRETKSALSNRNLLITGLVQARYAYDSDPTNSPISSNLVNHSEVNPPVVHSRHQTFDIPNAIVGFSGLLYRDYQAARNLQFSLSLAAYPGSLTNYPPGTATITEYMAPLDAYLTYQFLPTIENDGDRLSLTLGQQLVPFGLEANTTEDLRPVIINAQFVAPTGFNLRQIGLIAKGEFFAQYDFGYNYRQALIQVAAGVVNGNGPNTDDDNDYKDLLARVAVTIPAEYNSWLRELRIGASAYHGRTNLVDANSTYQGTGDRNRYGVDVYYNHWPFGFTYEYARLFDTTWNNGAKGVDRESHVATAFFSFGQQFLTSIKNTGKYDDWWPKTFQPFFRYDFYDPNLAAYNDYSEILTAGFNVFFAETTKFQLNLNDRRQHYATAGTAESQEALAQFQYGF